jgi:hypothetical protein
MLRNVRFDAPIVVLVTLSAVALVDVMSLVPGDVEPVVRAVAGRREALPRWWYRYPSRR